MSFPVDLNQWNRYPLSFSRGNHVHLIQFRLSHTSYSDYDYGCDYTCSYEIATYMRLVDLQVVALGDLTVIN